MMITIRHFNLESKEFEDVSLNCCLVQKIEKNGTGSVVVMDSGDRFHSILGQESMTNAINNALMPEIVWDGMTQNIRNN